uniref:Teratocyte bracovirus protein n=1 Tax=Cotesia flavipes TaxID=89805 RepID=A0A8K1YTT2_COTFL|nr:teratocyte bracovirus protein [Cotesia flavipes]
MRIFVVCVTYFFAFSVANITASESVRHNVKFYSKLEAGIQQYQYRSENSSFSTASSEKMNEDGSKSLIDKRESMDKRGNNTSITRTIEETIIDPQNSNVIKVIYSRVVEEIDANNPNKSTYETYQTESYPNAKTNNLFGNISPASTIFESNPLLSVIDLKSHLPQKEVGFTDYNQIPTPTTSHGYGAPSEQAGVICRANSPQSASEAGSSQLNLKGGMNGANLRQFTSGQERLQSYPSQVPSPEAPSRTGSALQKPHEMYGTDNLVR